MLVLFFFCFLSFSLGIIVGISIMVYYRETPDKIVQSPPQINLFEFISPN